MNEDEIKLKFATALHHIGINGTRALDLEVLRSTTAGLEDLLKNIMDIAINLVPVQSCTIYLYDRRSRMMAAAASTIIRRQLNINFSTSIGIVGRCFSSKTPFRLEKAGDVR